MNRREGAAVAKYKLLGPHYSEEDKLLETGTEVGDGTEHKWTRRPTAEMEALDESGRVALERERTRAHEHGLSWGRIAPIDDLPLTVGEADAKYETEVREAAVETERRAAPAAPLGRSAAPTLADRGRR
jgi:hypothetical protein